MQTSVFAHHFVVCSFWTEPSKVTAGHVRLNRMDKRSQLNCLKECGRLLGLGCSVLFFPEGTRTTDGKMAAFKKVWPCLSSTALAGVSLLLHY